MPAKEERAPVPNARPEIELLLCCARTRVDEVRAGRIRALVQSRMDWEYLIRMAQRHGLLPLLYWQLKTICPDVVTEPHVSYLRERFYRNIAHNLHLTSELSKIVKLFSDHEIPLIPYKGPALATSVYGNLGLRQFVDLDIMLRRPDVLRAAELLRTLGYSPELELTAAQEEAYLQSRNEYNFQSSDGESFVELHWDVVAPHLFLSLNQERLWQRRQNIYINRMMVSTFSPEDLLLILCIHSNKHLWRRVSWLCDIAELINSHMQMNWELVLREAEAAGARRVLCIGLLLANRLLGTEVPASVMQVAKRDKVAETLSLEAEGKMFQADDSLPPVSEMNRFYLSSIESRRDRLRYCLRLAVTPVPEDWQYVRLPDNLYTLYYLIRPYRLLIKYGLGPLARLVKRHT